MLRTEKEKINPDADEQIKDEYKLKTELFWIRVKLLHLICFMNILMIVCFNVQMVIVSMNDSFYRNNFDLN